MVIVISFAIVLLVVAFLMVAVVELYRDIELLRRTIGAMDDGTDVPLDVGPDDRPSEVGLPRSLDDADHAFVVLVTDVCATCSVIVTELAPRPPDAVHVLLSSSSAEDAEAWLASHGMAPDADRVRFDAGDRVSRRLGVQTSPLLIEIVAGRFAQARTLPSVRTLRRAIASAAPDQGTTEEGTVAAT